MSKLFRVRLTHALSFAIMLIALLCHPLALVAESSPDFDGVVGKSDLQLLISVYGSGEGDENYDAKYDLDGDGEITKDDLRIFIGSYGSSVTKADSPPSENSPDLTFIALVVTHDPFLVHRGRSDTPYRLRGLPV